MRGDFFDTNILIYAASADELKAERADVLLSGGGTISAQVLNEFATVAHRKLTLEWSAIRRFLGGLEELLNVEPITALSHRTAIDIAERYRIAFYDAVIVASALNAGCTTLFTEDLHHGMTFGGKLRVINPFADVA